MIRSEDAKKTYIQKGKKKKDKEEEERKADMPKVVQK